MSCLIITTYTGVFDLDVYVYDKNLKIVAIIDSYNSLIWANRYNELGDCELYLPATPDNFSVLKIGNYLARIDDDMVCQINSVEIDQSVENGNYMIVTGVDVKNFLDRRIVMSTATANGRAELFARELVNNSLGALAQSERQIVDNDGNLIFRLGDEAGFTENINEQVSYKNVGEKIREYCLSNGWGYRVKLNTGCFYFELFKGTDLSDRVFFAEMYENISESRYVDDFSDVENVALIAGEGEGIKREKVSIGTAASDSRYEVFVDAKDTSKSVSLDQIYESYPGGTLSQSVYRLNQFDFQIYAAEQLASLVTAYPNGQEIIINGQLFYRVSNAVIARVVSGEYYLDSQIYKMYLYSRGNDEVSEHIEVVEFEGTVTPVGSFEYKRDFQLGDIVTIITSYGIRAKARIIEILEKNDENGYSIEPTFQNLEVAANG